jgi:hypothetical protein
MREPCAGDPASRDGVANRPIRSAPSTHSQTEAIMARNTNTQAQAPLASPAVTLTPEALKELLAEAVAEALAQKGKVDRSTDVESLTLKAFTRKGFKDVQPRVNVKTYNLWISEGRKVKEGEKFIKVKNLRLFHISQTEPIAAAEKNKLLKEREAKIAAKAKPAEPAQAQA